MGRHSGYGNIFHLSGETGLDHRPAIEGSYLFYFLFFLSLFLNSLSDKVGAVIPFFYRVYLNFR